MIEPIPRNQTELTTWVVDQAGTVAVSDIGLALLNRMKNLAVPDFVSTEEAMAWGSALTAEQRDTLVHVQRASSNAARVEANLQRMVYLATQSQLMREAVGTFAEPVMNHRRDHAGIAAAKHCGHGADATTEAGRLGKGESIADFGLRIAEQKTDVGGSRN